MWKLYEIRILVSIKFYWNTAMLIHLHFVCNYFLIIVAELSSCCKEPYGPQSWEYLLSDHLQKTFADLPPRLKFSQDIHLFFLWVPIQISELSFIFLNHTTIPGPTLEQGIKLNVSCSVVTLCEPIYCSSPGSSVQARIQEWAVIPFSRGSSQLRDWTPVSCIADRFFTIWTTREALNKGLDHN